MVSASYIDYCKYILGFYLNFFIPSFDFVFNTNFQISLKYQEMKKIIGGKNDSNNKQKKDGPTV